MLSKLCALVAVVALSVAVAVGAVMPSSKCDLSNIDAFLIDLDGTMYEPGGLVDGAADFYAYLLESKTPYLFVSDTGAKGAVGVQAKFASDEYHLGATGTKVSLDNIITASTALAMYMLTEIPREAYVYIVESATKTSSCVNTLRANIDEHDATLWDSWTWRTSLSEDESIEWAAAASKRPTFVVSCVDHQPGELAGAGDPVTQKPGYTAWTYEILQTMTWLVQNGATMVAHAPDTHNAYPRQRDHVGVDLKSPGPGAFVELVRRAAYPQSIDRVHVVGKGGDYGGRYIFALALARLRKLYAPLKFSDTSRVAMVGDCLDTDIKGATLAHMSSVFVQTGVHKVADEQFYPLAVPTCALASVGDIAGAVTSSVSNLDNYDRPANTMLPNGSCAASTVEKRGTPWEWIVIGGAVGFAVSLIMFWFFSKTRSPKESYLQELLMHANAADNAAAAAGSARAAGDGIVLKDEQGVVAP